MMYAFENVRALACGLMDMDKTQFQSYEYYQSLRITF